MLLCAPMQLKADLQINEVMQSNVHGIMDDLNEYPDAWLELYNNSDQSVNLKDYAVSVKDAYKKAYRLPDRTVKPGEYVIVYCDKTDHAEFPDALMHADFRIDSGKGNVYLWKNGELAETLELKKMPAPDIAYGRQSETSDEWGYQAKPTPGAANCGQLVKDMLPDPVFGHKGGLLNAPVSLELSMPADAPAKAQLHYTLDGSAPDADSPVYTSPINIEESTVVRAVLTADGYMSPLPVTASFIFHPREQTLPVVSLTGDPDSFYGSKTGILVEGDYNPDKFNYLYDWRRPVNIEYFETDGTCPINQVIETRLKGSSSRTKPMRSMVAYANKRFGVKRLDYEFFPDQKPGITDFKSLELRNAGNDFHELFMRDALAQRIVGANTDMDWAAVQPVIIYINGEYKGMLNLRERSNEDNIYTNYGGLEDVDVIENWYEVKEGSKDLFDEFKKFYSQEGQPLDEYEARMDVSEFLNMMVAESVFCNTDFPSNNIVMWRPTAPDGKWRWIAKDLDTGLGSNPQKWDLAYFNWFYDPNYDTAQIPGNVPAATLLFRRLMELDGARNEFIDRAFVFMGDFMKPQSLNALMEEMWQEMAIEHQAMKELYDFDWEWNKHDLLRARASEWYANRVNFMYGHIADFYNAGTPVKLDIDLANTADATVSLNGIPLVSDSFDGKWSAGRALAVTAEHPDGATTGINGWEMTVTKNGEETVSVIPTKGFEMTMPEADSVKLVPSIGALSVEGIEAPESATAQWYDLQGRYLGSRKPAAGGIYIRKAGNRVSKVIL